VNALEYKIYVRVAAEFTADGKMTPLWITWKDGRKYVIDRVRSCERAASRKAGGVGLRYTCMISGSEHYLFYEENYRWFVEAKME
jgi:hypothetical protein